MQKTRFSQKLSNLELWCLLMTYSKLCKLNWAFQRIGSLQSKMAEIRHLENRHDVISFCRGWSNLDKILQAGTEWHVDCGDVWKWKPDVEFQYGGHLGEFNGMSRRTTYHIACDAATWWIHCHDCRATCHIAGCKNSTSIRYIENRFSPYFFLFLMQFRLWRAAAFVSSPRHLFD